MGSTHSTKATAIISPAWLAVSLYVSFPPLQKKQAEESLLPGGGAACYRDRGGRSRGPSLALFWVSEVSPLAGWRCCTSCPLPFAAPRQLPASREDAHGWQPEEKTCLLQIWEPFTTGAVKCVDGRSYTRQSRLGARGDFTQLKTERVWFHITSTEAAPKEMVLLH